MANAGRLFSTLSICPRVGISRSASATDNRFYFFFSPGDEYSVKMDKLESKEIFLPDMAVNQKVALWFGDITRLEIDAVVNSTNEMLLLEARGGIV